MQMTSRILLACGFFVCWLLFFGWSAYSYFAESPPSQSSKPAATQQSGQTNTDTGNKPAASEQTLPWKDYQEALKAERETLQKQAEVNLDRLDKLQDRVFSAIVLLGGLILGFIYFLFGQTRKEVETQLTTQISDKIRLQLEQIVPQKLSEQVDPFLKAKLAEQERVMDTTLVELKENLTGKEFDLAAMHAQMTALQTDLNQLDATVRQINSYRDRQVIWFFSGATNTAPIEINVLQKAGFNITQPEIKLGDPFELGLPDLVIFTYDKSDEGKRRLQTIAGLMRKNVPEVWLLIHTKSNNDIGDEERRYLEGIWYVPVNFPATLLVNAQALIRRWTKY